MIGRQQEKAHAKQKAAENHATAAQRKQEDAEREALLARGELEELREQLERLQVEADGLRSIVGPCGEPNAQDAFPIRG